MLREVINERRKVLYLTQGEGYLDIPFLTLSKMKSPVGDEDGALVFPLESALGLGDGLDRISPEGAVLREGEAYIYRDELIPDPDSRDILTLSPASLAVVFKGGAFHVILAGVGVSIQHGKVELRAEPEINGIPCNIFYRVTKFQIRVPTLDLDLFSNTNPISINRTFTLEGDHLSTFDLFDGRGVGYPRKAAEVFVSVLHDSIQGGPAPEYMVYQHPPPVGIVMEIEVQIVLFGFYDVMDRVHPLTAMPPAIIRRDLFMIDLGSSRKGVQK